MTPLAHSLLVSLGVLALLMTAMWLLSIVRRDASIVDPFWGTGFVIVTWIACGGWPADGRAMLMTALITLWGLRLSVFLLWRNWGHGEDHRYAAMRKHHGPRFVWVSLLTVFWLQGIILWFVSWPVQAVVCRSHGQPLSWLDGLGVIVWTIGLVFETLGDWQLARFKVKPENTGRVLNSGLWRYTRHPNYFGDFCVWWGLYLLALSAGAWWTIGSPLLMSVLLMKVSGVTLLESTITQRRPEYDAYRQRTNAFFPGLPRRS